MAGVAEGADLAATAVLSRAVDVVVWGLEVAVGGKRAP